MSRPTLFTLALAMAALNAAPVDAQSYKDTKFGYSIKTLPKWNAVPPKPDEKHLVMKWASKREIRELPAEIHVYVFNRKTKGGYGDIQVSGDVPATVRAALARLSTQKSYAAFVKSDMERAGMSLVKGKKLRIRSPKNRTVESALMYETSRESRFAKGTYKMADYFVLAGVVTTPDWEYAVECFASEKALRKLKGSFQSIIKSFRLLDAPEVAERPASADTGGSDAQRKRGAPGDYERTTLTEREEARKRAREQVARTPGWWYHETPRYMVVTNCEKKRKPFIKDIGRRLEAIRNQYEKDFPPAKPISAVSIVRVCKDKKGYRDYGGSRTSAGYWSSSAKELVFYRADSTDMPLMVLNHEAFHQYIFYSCGKLSPHAWYNEGYGDYYAGAVIQGKRISKIKPFLWRRDTIRNAARKGTHVPIKDIIKYTQREYYTNPKLCYAQGWSMIYFLNTALPKSHRWQKILPTYLKTLQTTKDREKAVDAAFKDVDLDAFEAAWRAYTIRGTKVRKR
ncbi:MAG: hypothetical protein HRU14_05155 [Planctomycetes bacterium]|nr:hypothetical protein [Planctomycetota bacterium]